MNAIPEDQKVNERIMKITHKVLVLSGKGGVGKSTVAVNLAVALAAAGKRVGLLDVDVHGPSVPKLLGVDGMPLHGGKDTIYPFAVGENLKVMSIGFLLRSADDAVIWRGPMKFNVIKQFLSDVEWGELDYLIVDSPPGTGDEPLSVVQLIQNADGAVIVTTPQDVAVIDVRKCINFCRQVSLPVIGVIENMSGFICPKCGERTDIFKSGGGEHMAMDMGVPFLGRVPVDPAIVSASDEGKPYLVSFPNTEAGKIFAAITAPLLALKPARAGKAPATGDTAAESTTAEAAEGETSGSTAGKGTGSAAAGTAGNAQGTGTGNEETPAAEPETEVSTQKNAEDNMRIALPVTQGKLSMHFGHCDTFALVDIDAGKKEILNVRHVDAPPHQPGLLPQWLHEQGADMIIACGMGSRAQMLFADKGIEVVVGASSEDPESVVRAYMAGTLTMGENICDH
jgi:ATP-binding protein involved in chromosome partitioning